MSEVIFSVFPSENFIDLGLYQFGWEKCDPPTPSAPLPETTYLFHYCISGTGTLIAENTKGSPSPIQIKSGQGFMFFPIRSAHYIADHEIPWNMPGLNLTDCAPKRAIDLTGLSRDQPIYKARYKDIADLMKSEMLYIVNHKEESSFHLIGHLHLFIDSLMRSSTSIPKPPGQQSAGFLCQKAISYIEQNFPKQYLCGGYRRFLRLKPQLFRKNLP